MVICVKLSGTEAVQMKVALVLGYVKLMGELYMLNEGLVPAIDM